MITIKNATIVDIENLLKAEPFKEWLGDVKIPVIRVTNYLVTKKGSEQRIVEYVQNISMHIWRLGQKVKPKVTGQLMNATWSEEYLTVNIPHDGILRFCENGDVTISLPEPPMSLGLGESGIRLVEYKGIQMQMKVALFLEFAEYLKRGLSAPFMDMVIDGEL